MTNSELKYHFHPEKGWVNDPNGLVYFNGYYHIFYQHAPDFEQPWHQPMHWGHARTKDFLNYEELPIALYPDREFDINGVWSGTAAVIDGVLYLFYASIDTEHRQTVSVAWSRDGINFEKSDKNPIIPGFPSDGSGDFRDPAVFRENGKIYIVMASGNPEKKTGNLLLYEGTDIEHFTYKGILCEYEDCKYCECPSLVKCGDKYILSASVCTLGRGHYFEVLYGDFDGSTFKSEIVSHFQKGPDEYAGQIFNDDKGRVIMISWIPGWKYQDMSKCIGCMSLPLEIKPCGGILKAYPVEEVRGIIGADDTVTDAYVTEKYVNGGEEVYIAVKIEE